jgi:hypothetical protein
VDKVQFGTHAGLPDSESMRETHEIPLHPTPGEVLTKIAGVIAMAAAIGSLYTGSIYRRSLRAIETICAAA